MSYDECAVFEKKLAYHSAPSLLGIKCANLLSIRQGECNVDENISRFNSKAVSKGLKIRKIAANKDTSLLLIYNQKLMERRFSESKSMEILNQNGYSAEKGIDYCIDTLSMKIQSEKEFPHEIGVFLGYPPEDVEGFIENKGSNFKLCGCWKVYGDAEKARRTFINYDKCRKFLCNQLNSGHDIYMALKIS